MIFEHVVPGQDENRPAQRLREYHARGADGHVVERQHRLRGHERLIHAETAAEAETGLVADPHGVDGIDFPGREQAGTGGDENGGDEHERRVVAYRGDEDAGQKSGDDVGHDEGEVHDAGFSGGDVFDGLEPDGEVVDQEEVGAPQPEGEPGSEGDAPLTDNPWGYGCFVLLPDLNSHEGYSEERCQN